MSSVDITGDSTTLLHDVIPPAALASGYANRITVADTISFTQAGTYSGILRYFMAFSHTGNQVWIDFNDDGVFDTLTENVTSVFPRMPAVSDAYDTANFSIAIPIDAAPGLHRMRIRNAWYNNTIFVHPSSALDPCDSNDNLNGYYSGLTADYMVRINGLPYCTGMSSAGVVAGPSNICPGIPFFLVASGGTLAAGLSWQWYQAPAGSGSFAPLPGATATYVNIPGQSASMDYRLVVSCSSSGLSDTSAVFTVGENLPYQCYCTSLGGYSFDARIDSVAIPGTTLNNYTPLNYNIYTSFPDTGSATATLMQGATYSIYARIGAASGYNAYVWIDYDHSGTFDSSEFTLVAAGASSGTSFTSLSIPFSALTGVTGMRVRSIRSIEGISPSDACSYETSGETEDYLVNIAPGINCTGSPDAGAISSSASAICSGSPFNLSSTGFSSGYGISYQWYAAASGTGTYAAIPSATSPLISGITQSISTDYILIATCAASGLSDTSAVITVGQNPFYLCYCSPVTGTTLNSLSTLSPLDSVAIVGSTLNDDEAYSGLVYHQNWPMFTATTAYLSQGTNYSIVVNSNGSSDYVAGAWIDYDHNGIFDNSEYIPITNHAAAGNAAVASFIVPAGADTGLTGMRVRTTDPFYSLSGGAACAYLYDGATADYVIQVLSGVPCSGAPVTGGSFASVASACPAQTFTLQDTGYVSATGITYQWISAPAGSGMFSSLAGVNEVSYTVSGQTAPTDYALVATCASSGISDTSAIVQVDEDPFYLCYCASRTGNPLNDDATNTPIDSVALTATTLNNSTPSGIGIYQQYWPVTPATTAVVLQGEYYTLALNSNGPGDYGAAAWIDYDHSGTFDPSEYTLITSLASPGLVSSAAIYIPASADTGLTGLSVRTTSSSYSMTDGDACTEEYDGATADYVISIQPGTACSGTPDAGLISAAVTSICPGASFTLSATGFTTGTMLQYQWYSSPAGLNEFAAIAGATQSYYTVSSQSSATDYLFAVTCSASGTSDSSNVLSIAESPFYACYCSALGSDGSLTHVDTIEISGTSLSITDPSTLPFIQYPPIGDSTGNLTQLYTYALQLHVADDAGYNAGVWIDYDHNGVFDASEFVSTITGVSGSSVLPFTIPLSSDTNLTAMRIRIVPSYVSLSGSSACSYYGSEQTIDILMHISPAPLCSGVPVAGAVTTSQTSACASDTVFLTDTGYSVAAGIMLQWQSSADSATWVDIAGATSAAYFFSGLAVDSYYRIVASCELSGLFDSSNVVHIHPAPCFCLPAYEHNGINVGAMHLWYLAGYGGSTIDDTFTLVNYIDNTLAAPLTLQQGGVYNGYIAYAITSDYTENQAWIDFNDDGVFDASEAVTTVVGNMPGYYSDTAYLTVTIPDTATHGLHRMRVRNARLDAFYYTGISPVMDPCAVSDGSNHYYNGIAADYTVNVIFADCAPVTGVIAGSISSTSAVVHWDSIPGNLIYQYAVDTSATMFTTVSSTLPDSIALISLFPGTTYYVHVRSSCTPGNFSPWTSFSFTTNCPPVTSLSVSAITASSATLTWNSANDLSYQYAADTSFSPPALGIAVTDTTAAITGLVAGTWYYAHVRSQCKDTTTGWLTIPFITHCDSVSSVAISGITDSSATITWGALPSSDYLYAIDNTPSPASGGVATADTVIYATSLTAGTLYYVHIRNICADTTSAWTTASFITGSCDTVVGVAVVSSDTALSFIWPAITGSLGYYYQLDTVATPPAGLGSFTTDTSIAFSGLVSNTQYYLHIRNVCVGGLAGWIAVPAFTSPCAGVSGLTVSSITDTGAQISWSPVAGSEGYFYVLDNSSVTPAVMGTFSATEALSENILAPGTIYYIHVRNYCGSVDTSAWATVSFTTHSCDTVSGISYVVSDTGVIATWLAAVNAVGYEVLVDVNSSAPSSGIFTTSRSDTVSTLLPGSAYFIHVRVYCGGGYYSSWATVPFVTTVGIDELQIEKFFIKAYPNPVGENVNIVIQGTRSDIAAVTITDVAGKVVRQCTVTSASLQVDTHEWPAGIYFINYTDDQHKRSLVISKQ